MNTNEAINILRQEAKRNPAANSFFHVCALRKRARSNINIRSLAVKMQKEGFNYTMDQYREIIKLLSDLGFGKLDVDSKGRITGIKDIKVSLQSLGQSACGQESQLKSFSKRNKFSMVGSVKPKQEPTVETEIDVSIKMRGKAVKIQIPKDLTAEEIAAIIAGFQKVIQ